MNAGGTGGPTPGALTQDGVTEIFAQNVLGHVVLLEELISAGLLTEVAVLVGSEAARGVPKMRIPRPDVFDLQRRRIRFGDRRLVLRRGQVQRDARLRSGQVPRGAVDGRHGAKASRAQVHHDVARKHGRNRGATRPARACPRRRQPHLPSLRRAGIGNRAQARVRREAPGRRRHGHCHCRAASSTRAPPRRSPDRSSTRPRSFLSSMTPGFRTTPTRPSTASSPP